MKNRAWIKSLTLVSQLGIVMITPILICTFIGIFVDDIMNKSPLFTIIFLLLGVGAAFRNLFYHTMKQVKKNQKEDRDE